MRIIVSFTSYPPRINSVYKVVESLYRQTLQADEIILYLSLDEFPAAEKNLPETLRRLIGKRAFRVEWVHGNLKSHKKYFYALQKYKDAAVITIDDDKIYAETMIAELIKSYKRFPCAVSARRVRIMLRKTETLESYSKWEQSTYLEEYKDTPRMDLCAIGVGAICYPTRLVSKEWFWEEMIVKTAENNDDLWVKYREIISNIPVVYTKPSQEDITIENSQCYRLTDDNLHGNGNDQCIYELFTMLKRENSNIYNKYMRSLMTWEEFALQQKRYYTDFYNAVFERMEDTPVYFYGAGKIARSVLRILADWGLIRRVEAVIVSGRTGNPSMLYGLQVRTLSELDPNKKFGVIIGVNEINKKEITDRLSNYNYQDIGLDIQMIMRYYLW